MTVRLGTAGSPGKAAHCTTQLAMLGEKWLRRISFLVASANREQRYDLSLENKGVACVYVLIC